MMLGKGMQVPPPLYKLWEGVELTQPAHETFDSRLAQ